MKQFNPLKQQMNDAQIKMFIEQLMKSNEFITLNNATKLSFVSSQKQIENGTFAFKINAPCRAYDAKCLIVYASGYFRGAPYQNGQTGYCMRYGHRLQKYWQIDRLLFADDVPLNERYEKMFQRMIAYCTKHKLM